MKKNSRKITVALISIFMSILIMSSMALPARAALPAKYDKDVYIADMLSNNYRGYGIEGAPESYKKLQYYTHPKYLSASEAFVDSLLWDEEFLAALMSWETATFNPSDAVGDALKAKDFYKVILYNILDCEFKGTDYLQKSIKSFDALHSNLIKGVIDVVANYYEIEYEEILATDFGDLSEDLKNAIIDSNKSVYKAWDGRSSRLSFLSTGINFVGTLAQFLDTLASYFALCALEEDYKFLLTELYNNCSIADFDMKAALLEVKNVCSATLDEFMASVLSEYTLSMSSFAYKEAVGFFWDSMVATVGSGVGIGILIGQAIGRPLSNLLFSTDQTIDQFYAMKAMVNFENLISSTVVKLQSDYKSNPVSESAKRFLKAVDLLFATYDLSSDYAAEFCDIIFSKKFAAAISKLFIKTNTFSQEKISKVIENGKKGIGFARESLLDIEFYKSYIEVDYPEVYRSENLEYFDYETAYGEIEPAYYSYEDGSEAHYGIFYRFIDGGVEITGYESTCGGEVVIPGTIEGKKVISIAPLAFNSGDNITKVTIPDTVTDIGNMAFWGCESLESVNIPSQLTKIRKYLFADCKKLKSIVIPDSVTVIEEKAFKGCEALTELTIGDNLAEVSEDAFAQTPNLRLLSMPSSIIDNTLPAFTEIKTIDTLVLRKSSTNILNPDNPWYKSNVKKIIVGEGIVGIEEGAFFQCRYLESVVLPESLTYISGRFDICTSLVDVYVTDLASWLNIKFDSAAANPMCQAENLYFNNNLVTEIVLPDGLQTVEDYKFYGCEKFVSVSIPDSVISIGKQAFDGCVELADLELSENITTIGDYAFRRTNITEIIIPDSVMTIGENSFGKCYSLQKVRLGKKLTSIANAFQYCTSLTDIIIPDTITDIRSSFVYCTSLESVTIPDSVNDMGAAFYNCKSLVNIVIPEKVTRIGNHTFENCINLKSVTLHNNIDSIGDKAFYDCQKLESIEIPESVTSIGARAFYQCKNLKSLYLSDNVTTIMEWAFYGCSGLEEIRAPYYINITASKSELSLRPFSGIPNLRKITISQGKGNYPMSFWGQSVKEIFILDGTDISDLHLGDYTYLQTLRLPYNEDKQFFMTICNKSATIGNLIVPVEMDIDIPNVDDIYKLTLVKGKTGDAAYNKEDKLCPWYNSRGHIKELVIEEGVKSFKNSFSIFNRLEKITVADNHEVWYDIDGVLFSNDTLVCYPPAKTETEYTVPEGITKISSKAFGKLLHLNKIVVPGNCNINENGIQSAVTLVSACDSPAYEYAKENGFDFVSNKHGQLSWSVIEEPTLDSEGMKKQYCPFCDTTIKTQSIPKNTLLTDKNVGISFEYVTYKYAGEVLFDVKKTDSQDAYEMLSSHLNVNRVESYDITMLEDGVAIQPNGKVKIKIPVSEDFVAAHTFVYFTDVNGQVVEKMDVTYDNGYYIFETDHFSCYSLVEEKHKYNSTITAPTCVDDGYTTNVCFCGYSCVTDITSPLGHLYEADVTAATCYDGGYTTYTCFCGDTYTDDETFATGHSYGNDNICDGCGDDRSVGCTCNCHKSGFSSFIWKILRFFYKLFKTNPVCSCGMAHY